MQTDWYKTAKPGTYVVIPAGTQLALVPLPEEIVSVLDVESATPFAIDADSRAMAQTFDVLGIDDCLRQSGYCVLRT